MHIQRPGAGDAVRLLATAACLLVATPMRAQPPSADLNQAFAAAWQRQPELAASQARRDAALAQRDAAGRWTPDPPALELFSKTDRGLRNRNGVREHAIGVAVPLWLPGERGRSAALADAELAAADSRMRAAQLRVAAGVRSAWWDWHRASIEVVIARDQLDNTRRLAADVAARLKAGDLARADRNQADAAVAAAESGLAQADAALASAAQQLRSIVGQPFGSSASAEPEALPAAAAAAAVPDEHAVLAELTARATAAERTAALAATQSRANPELALATTRERGAFGEDDVQTVTLALRFPFGGGPRHTAKVAAARADAFEAHAQLALARDRLAADNEAARARIAAARMQLAAAERRAALSRETRGFFDKSFRMGETDLPARLRIEAEATEAERQSLRSRIELAAAISAWRQALGLLPE